MAGATFGSSQHRVKSKLRKPQGALIACNFKVYLLYQDMCDLYQILQELICDSLGQDGGQDWSRDTRFMVLCFTCLVLSS